MSVGRYALGFAALVCVFGSLCVAALTLRRCLLAQWRGAPARLAESVLGLALLEWISQALGTVGLLRFGPLVATTVALAAGLRLWLRPAAEGSGPHAAETADARRAGLSGALLAGIAVLAGATVLAEWAAPTLRSYDNGILGLDSIWYHLPWAVSYAQTGTTTGFRFTDVEYLNAFYPATAELFHGVGIILMGNDVLSPVINLMWLVLVLLGAWCIGQARGVGPAALIGAALAMGVPTILYSQPGSADNDVAGVFFLVAAVALLLNGYPLRAGAGGDRHPPVTMTRTAPMQARAGRLRALNAAPLAVAGVAAGMAISIKLSMLGAFLGLTAGVIAIGAPGRRRIAGGVWILSAVAAGGYWYLRNLIAVGNPLPWFSLGVLPTPAAPIQAHTAFSVAHYLRDPTVLKQVFGPGLADGFGSWWAVIVLVAIIGALLCVTSRQDRLVQMVGLVVLAAVVAYIVTPGTAAGQPGHPRGFQFNLRYSAPALTLALVAAPLASPLRGRRMCWVTFAALVGLLAATLSANRLWTPGYVLPGAVGTAAVATLFGVAAFLAWRTWPRSTLSLRAVALLAVFGALLAAGAAIGYSGERHYLRGRFASKPGLSPLADLWQWARSVHHARIGIVGTFGGFFAYPLGGVDGSNRVQYIAHRGAHGSFTPIQSCRQWREAVDAGRYRYVVTTASRDVWSRALGFSPEGSWTRSDPGARLLFPHTERLEPVVVYEIVHPLDPARC